MTIDFGTARLHPQRCRRPGIATLALLAGIAFLHDARSADLAIPGSGNPEHVLRQLSVAFNARQTRHRVSVPPSAGTAGALRDIEAGTASLGRVGRTLTNEEKARGLVFVPIGRDAVVFVAGAEVTAAGVTRAQMYDAFTGKITDWRELGGRSGPIRAVGRESGDASRSAINKVITPFATIVYHENVKLAHLDPNAIALFDRYGTSLGFLNRSALGAAATRLKALALDGTEPSLENLASGRYPIALDLGLIHKQAALPEAAAAFLAFLRTPEALGVLRQNGIAPARAGS